MKLEEAIERLERHYVLHFDVPRMELDEAALLGIEALKGIKAVRQLHPELSPFPLPGETKD